MVVSKTGFDKLLVGKLAYRQADSQSIMRDVRIQRARTLLTAVLLILGMLLCGPIGCSSGSREPDNSPEKYGLSLYESPDGDWSCYLPSPPEVVAQDNISLTLFFPNSTIEQWRSYSDESYVAVVRITGEDADELISLAKNDEDACWEQLETIGTFVFLGDTGWAPAYPTAFEDRELSVPATSRYETDDRATPTLEFCANYAFRNRSSNAMREGSWGVAGTYTDDAFYVLATLCDTNSLTRSMQSTFEAHPDSGFKPAEHAVPEGAIDWTEASSHIGEVATVCGPVKDSSFLEASNGQPCYIDVGAAYPDDSRVSIVVWGEDRANFPEAPESLYQGKTICVTGELYAYNNATYVKVSSPDQVKVLD